MLLREINLILHNVFFTGTSHEINKVELVSNDVLRELMPWEKVEEHRQRALSPLHPR